jgi:hypothetical protein
MSKEDIQWNSSWKLSSLAVVTSQDFIKFWGNFFCFYFACVD